MTGRQKAYLAVRGSAAGVFVLSATVVPPGTGAGLLAMAAGIVGVLTCIGVNAGGPGERAGARAEHHQMRSVRPPQGDWPPYDPERVVDGELVEPRPDPAPDRHAR
jgi:hypothetical protein